MATAAATSTVAPLVRSETVSAAATTQPTGSKHFQIQQIERTTVRIPYRETPRRAMDRELPHWRYSEIFQVHLASGKVGIGETLLYYTWGVTDDEDVERALNQNAVEMMWDDSLGAGLQMALFDAVGKTSEVPIHRLLGQQVHKQTPLSWWNIDMPPEDMKAECLEALRSGYLSYKTKGRPWFDLWQQVEIAAAVVPDDFKIDMDFNDTLLTAERAIPILKDLEKYPQIDIFETPIPQRDAEGTRRIRESTRVKIALHYGTPGPRVVVEKGVCDGFVIGGGASRVMRQGRFSGEVDMPFWLQLVGTGITAAFSLHFGAVLSHARWPAVNCHQLYEHQLLKAPIAVVNGFAQVPNQPGLGYDLDLDALERYRVPKPQERPDPPRLVETRWPDGKRMYFASDGKVNFMLRQGVEGNIPFYLRGVTTGLLPDDGTQRWRELFERATKAPVRLAR
jgi:galactonate dehydratase